VGLAEREQQLAEASRAKQGEITAAENAITAFAPRELDLQEFVNLAVDLDIDAKIEAARTQLRSLGQADAIQTRSAMVHLSVPQLDADLSQLLVKTLEGVEAGAEARLAEHINRHRMGHGGENWIAEGMGYIQDDECPYCGRDEVDAIPLVRTYRAIFSDVYNELQAEIRAALQVVEDALGDGARGQLQTLSASNEATAEFWGRLCDFEPVEFPNLDRVLGQLQQAHNALIGLLGRKAGAPLEPIVQLDELENATALLALAGAAIEAYNVTVNAANAVIEERKRAAAAGDLEVTTAELARLEAVKLRHAPANVPICETYIRLQNEKSAIEATKAAVRGQLEEHTRVVMPAYEARINELLDLFNAGFGIARTQHGYPGGTAASSYQLVIDETLVQLGDANTPPDRPCFKNTLSAGDRTTLALALFLAQVELEPDLAERIVVFDDPLSSQDAFRRRQTIYEIQRIGRACAQVIVLSHDAQFLKHVWDKCPRDDRVALQLIFHPATGSKLGAFDLNDACRGRAAAELDDLVAFRATGAGDPHEIIKKLRIVLETHFRSTYAGAFLPDDTLGAILQKIREGGEQHSAHAHYETLDRINDYTTDYHHGEDSRDAQEPPLDPTELFGFVHMTLRTVNALQA